MVEKEIKLNEPRYVMMRTADYNARIILESEIKKYKDQDYTLLPKGPFPFDKYPVVTESQLKQTEAKLRSLFLFLKEHKLIFPAPFTKYEMEDFLEILFGDNDYSIENYEEATGILFELTSLEKSDSWKYLHYIFTLTFKDDDIKQRYIDYMECEAWKEQNQNEKQDPNWCCSSMLFFDFLTMKGTRVSFHPKSEYRTTIEVHPSEIHICEY